MLNDDIDGLALDQYAALVLDALPGASSLSVFDEHSECLWRDDQSKTDGQNVCWPPTESRGWQPLDERLFARELDHGGSAFACSLRGGAAEWFLCLSGDWPTGSEGAVRAQNALRRLRQLVSGRQALQQELNTTTDELIRRYEELNLVYNTDSDADHASEGSVALGGIVENCTEYLGVDVTVLYLTGKENVMMRAGPSGLHPGESDVIRELRGPILEWMVSHNDNLVINDGEERDEAGLDLPDGYRVVACPICDTKGRVRGTLCIVNRATSREFENGDRNLMLVMTDKAAKVIRANYDALTGLISREGFERAVTTVLSDARNGRREISLLHANIDQIHLVNDTFGHEVGDDLIRRVSESLRSELRGNDRVSRIGGDEFGILLTDCGEDNAQRMAERLCRKVGTHEVVVGSQRLDVGISVGVVQITDAFDSVVGAMAAADLACSTAKEKGRNRTYVYRSDDQDMKERQQQMNWVGRLQRAIREDRFTLFCQPIAPVREGVRSPHYELLLRMLDDDGGFVSPGIFMPVAERYHMMPVIDQWVVEHGLASLTAAQQRGNALPGVFAINLSGQSLTDRRTLDFILSRLREGNVDPEKICFEITETAAISNLSGAQNFIAALKDLGCRFALDDFGAGVTSFTSLRALDVDYLKIDGSFVVDMAEDPVSHAMVAAINNVGQTMQLDTIAEFVESAEIVRQLADLGVDFLQGYHIGRPRPLSEVLAELNGAEACIA